MKNPIVSICCITFNHEPYIRECLDGFLMQKTDFDFEILIHDDASTDKTADIIREYELKYPEIINPIYQTENQWSKGVRGMNAKYNFSRAQGKYIAMCEGDDYWTDPLKLQKQVDFLENNHDYVLSGHLREVVDENNNILKNKYSSPDFYTQCLVFRNVLKDDYLNNNLNIFNGDTFLITYLSNFGKKKILDFIGARYRVTSSGVWAGVDLNKRYTNALDSLKNMNKFFKENGYSYGVKITRQLLIVQEINHIVQNNKYNNIHKSLLNLQVSFKYQSLKPLKTLIIALKNKVID